MDYSLVILCFTFNIHLWVNTYQFVFQSLNMIFFCSIHWPANYMMPLFFYHLVILHCKNVLQLCFFLMCFLVDEHLDCFHVQTTTNKAAMNIAEQMSLWYDCASLGYMSKSSIAGSWSRLIPNFLRNRHTYFQSGCTILCFYQKRSRFPYSTFSTT